MIQAVITLQCLARLLELASGGVQKIAQGLGRIEADGTAHHDFEELLVGQYEFALVDAEEIRDALEIVH